MNDIKMMCHYCNKSHNPAVACPAYKIIQESRYVDLIRTRLRKIESWCNAYPLKVFPEPDLKKAREVLKEAGMTLDAISASNMRHVLKGIKDIVEGKV